MKRRWPARARTSSGSSPRSPSRGFPGVSRALRPCGNAGADDVPRGRIGRSSDRPADGQGGPAGPGAGGVGVGRTGGGGGRWRATRGREGRGGTAGSAGRRERDDGCARGRDARARRRPAHGSKARQRAVACVLSRRASPRTLGGGERTELDAVARGDVLAAAAAPRRHVLASHRAQRAAAVCAPSRSSRAAQWQSSPSMTGECLRGGARGTRTVITLRYRRDQRMRGTPQGRGARAAASPRASPASRRGRVLGVLFRARGAKNSGGRPARARAHALPSASAPRSQRSRV